ALHVPRCGRDGRHVEEALRDARAAIDAVADDEIEDRIVASGGCSMRTRNFCPQFPGLAATSPNPPSSPPEKFACAALAGLLPGAGVVGSRRTEVEARAVSMFVIAKLSRTTSGGWEMVSLNRLESALVASSIFALSELPCAPGLAATSFSPLMVNAADFPETARLHSSPPAKSYCSAFAGLL